MSLNELTAKVKKLKELKAFADEIAAEITTVEDELKAEMTAQGADEMTVDVYKLRYKTIKSFIRCITPFNTVLPKRQPPPFAASFSHIKTESKPKPAPSTTR